MGVGVMVKEKPSEAIGQKILIVLQYAFPGLLVSAITTLYLYTNVFIRLTTYSISLNTTNYVLGIGNLECLVRLQAYE